MSYSTSEGLPNTMSHGVAARLANIESLILTLKEDHDTESQPGLRNLKSALTPLLDEHVVDLKHYLVLMLDAISTSEQAYGGFEVQAGLISSQIENSFRDLAQNVASIVRNAQLEDRDAAQIEFEEQVELLKRNNSDFVNAITRLVAVQDAQDLLQKEAVEREVESMSQTAEIRRLQVALELAQSRQADDGAESTTKSGNSESDLIQQREAELVAQHREEIRLFKAKYHALFEEFAAAKGNIRVICRIRGEDGPAGNLIQLEDPDKGSFIGWTTLRASFENDSKKPETRDFEFQKVAGGQTTNQDIFHEVSDFAQSAALGRWCTVMAYGATGTGKSYTFLSEDGLIPSYIKFLFENAAEDRTLYNYEFQMSAVEIHLNKVYDLLQVPVDNKKVEVRLNGESKTILGSREEAIKILNEVVGRREVSSTQQNATSSRSHFILSIAISKTSLANPDEKAVKGGVRFLDLAGSERVGRNSLSSTPSPQQTLVQEQGTDINKSLLDLGKGIRALATRDSFYPSHNLTRYIRSSLNPGSRLLVVATVSSLKDNQSNTLNTLRWTQDATGRPSQGKLVQARASEPQPARTKKLPEADNSSRKREPPVPSTDSVKAGTPKRGFPNQGNSKR